MLMILQIKKELFDLTFKKVITLKNKIGMTKLNKWDV